MYRKREREFQYPPGIEKIIEDVIGGGTIDRRDLRNALLGTYANFLEDKITGNDRDLTVTETGEIQQRCRELLEKCRET